MLFKIRQIPSRSLMWYLGLDKLPRSFSITSTRAPVLKKSHITQVNQSYHMTTFSSNKSSKEKAKISQAESRMDSYFYRKHSSYGLHIIAGLLAAGLLYLVMSKECYIPLPNIVVPAQCSTKSNDGEKDKKSKKKDKKKDYKKSKKKKDKNIDAKGMTLASAIEKAQELCLKKKELACCPGIVVCVSVDGQQVYAEGFGYSDLENHIPMKPNSVLRIASISKVFTAVIIAKLCESGKIGLDDDVRLYVPDFPEKEFDGEKVTITVRQLLNHTSGIRHYKLDNDPASASDRAVGYLLTKFKAAGRAPFFHLNVKKKPDRKRNKADKTCKKVKKENSEMEKKEYYIIKPYKTTQEALSLFANDRLLAKPGTKFIYSTYGYTLLAAVIEHIYKRPFTLILKEIFGHMGLKETYLDYHNPIIYNRARYYVREKRGSVANAPYVDLSYKWAGGGLLSTSQDLVKFGNILLYSAQHDNQASGSPGYLTSSILSTFWQSQISNSCKFYGLGFELVPGTGDFGLCPQLKFAAGHSGAAVGVSSAIFILPRHLPEGFLERIGEAQPTPPKILLGVNQAQDQTMPPPSDAVCNPGNGCSQVTFYNTDLDLSEHNETTSEQLLMAYIKNKSKEVSLIREEALPKGVVVAVFVNMIDVSVSDVAEDIARIFEQVEF